MAIRQPPSSIKDANLRGFLQELRNAIGKTGEQVNQVAMRVRQITNTPPPPTEPPDPGPPGPPRPPGEPGDGLAPPAPISLTTTSDAWAIRLTWEQPADMPTDYDVTEIWCRNATSGDKHLAGSLRGNSFVFSGLDDHLLETGETWYFWVRNKDVENLFSAYYPDNDVGVSGQALPSPDTLINGQVIDIVNGPLYSWLGKVIQLLRGPTDVPDSVAARLKAQDDKLVAMINEVSVSSNGTIDPAEIWHFDATAQGWTVSGTGSPTVAWSNGVLVVTAGSATATVLSPTISVNGPAFHFVRARLKQTDTNEVPWTPTLAYKKSGSSTVYTYTPVTPAGDLSGFVEQDWEVADEETPVWTVDGTTITQVGFQLAAGQQVRFDWVAVGRLAPGASYSQVEAVRVSSNRVIRKPYTDFTPNFGPPNPYNGVALRVDDLWYDTATAEYDANNLLLKGGNRPHAWTGSSWTALNDSRIIHSEAELWNIAQAQAGPNGSAAYRISGISTKANDAYTLAGTKASIADVDNAFAGNQASLSSRLTYIESSTSEGAAAAIADFQKAAIGYATVATAHTYLGVTYKVGDIFEGNGSTIIYPALTYPDADYPQYAATDRKTVIDSVGVSRWNTIVGMTNPAAVKWNTGLPLAKAVKQVSVTPAAFCVVNGELDPTKTTESACVSAGGIWTPAGSPVGLEQQFQALQKADGELYAQYSVKIDNQGWVSGFGLSSTPSRDGNPFSEFGVRADRFFLAAPNTPKTQPQKLKYQGSGGSSNVVVTRFNDVANNRKLAYFVCADSSQFVPDQWATLSGISPSGWNTSFVISHKSGNTVYLELDDALYNSLGSNGLASAYGVPNTDSTATAQSANIPFIVLTSGRSINGVTYPPGVYATQAYIKKASITNAVIADAAITMAKISGSIYSDDFIANGGNVTNPLLTPNAPGWCITRDGKAFFGVVIARTGNLAVNAVTNIIANSTNGLMSWRPADLAYPIAVPLDGTRGRIALIITITIQAPSNAGCAVFFQAVVNGVRRDFKVAYSSAANGYGSCTIITYDNSLSTIMNIGLDSTVVGGAPAYWSWGYILMDIKR